MHHATAKPSLQEFGTTLGQAIAKQWDTFCRAFLSAPPSERTDGFVRIITGEPHPFGNFAVIANPADANAAAEAIDPLRTIEHPAAFLTCGEPAAPVTSIITDAGFALAEMMPAMAVDIDRLPATTLPAGYEIREVDARDDDAWCSAFARGYEIPRPLASYFGPVAANRNVPIDIALKFYAIARGDELVSTSVIMLEGGLAGIYCVSTIPEERGKGLAAHITAEPLRRTRAQSYRIGILQSSGMGVPVYNKLGFSTHSAVALFVRMPAGMSLH